VNPQPSISRAPKKPDRGCAHSFDPTPQSPLFEKTEPYIPTVSAYNIFATFFLIRAYIHNGLRYIRRLAAGQALGAVRASSPVAAEPAHAPTFLGGQNLLRFCKAILSARCCGTPLQTSSTFEKSPSSQ
jgi:hypothetical protein